MLRSPFQPSPRRRRASRGPASLLLGAVLALLPAALPQRAEALLLLRMRQVGSDIIEIRGGGTYSTVGLEPVPTIAFPYPSEEYPVYNSNPQSFEQAELQSGFSYITVGASKHLTQPENSVPTDLFFWRPDTTDNSFASAPTNPFGSDDNLRTGNTTNASQAKAFGIDGFFGFVLLPSNNSCSLQSSCTVGDSISTFPGLTFEALGVTPGSSFTWAWGTDENQKLTIQIETPVPGPLPLLGGAAAFGWSRRLRRRVTEAGPKRA